VLKQKFQIILIIRHYFAEPEKGTMVVEWLLHSLVVGIDGWSEPAATNAPVEDE
jgi:hypothetical protein